MPVSSVEESEAFNFLEQRTGLLDGVVISGGEPTLHRDLASLCRRLKAMGYDVKLDTNGSRPGVIRELLDESLLDYIAMDVKMDPFNYTPLLTRDCTPQDIISSIHLIMESAADYEFRTTCAKPIVNKDTISSIAELIKGAKLYALQRFNHTEVLDPGFFADIDSQWDEEDLFAMKSIAEKRVKECILR